MKQSTRSRVGALVLLASLCLVSRADPPAAAASEIAYLFGFLERSGCEFNRNGHWYDAAAAKAHLQHKYDLVSGTGTITTAETFIERVATKSSLSGQAYAVRCGSEESRPVDGWLREALAAHRRG